MLNNAIRFLKNHYLNIIAGVLFAVSCYLLIKMSYQVYLAYTLSLRGYLGSPWQTVVFNTAIAVCTAIVGGLITSLCSFCENHFTRRLIAFGVYYFLIDMSLLAAIAYFIYHIFFSNIIGLLPFVPPEGLPYLRFGNLEKLAWTGYLVPIGMFLYKDGWLVYRFLSSEKAKKAFLEWQWKGKVPFVIASVQNQDIFPSIEIGTDEYDNPVRIYGKDRPLQAMVVGPPGTGKSSRLFLPIIRQDLAHMQRYINVFADLYLKYKNIDDPDKREKFYQHMQTELGFHLNGITVIDPAKDLCDEAYKLALLHGIPEDMIVYLDPTNPNTKSLNVLRGPREQVAETLTMVLEGMAEEQDDFFRQAQRTVLKNYVYLLKTYRGDECTLEDLVAMYHDPRMVMDMVEAVEKTIPKDIDAIPDRVERGEWRIVRIFIDWFRAEGLGYEFNRSGELQYYPPGHKHAGKPVVKDLQAEFTRGTRNILSDIVTNPKLRRVLCDGDDVDLDLLLSAGGILLVNTAKGDLSELSKVFGKLVLMTVQNAIFRRPGKEKTRPMHSLIVDELPEYINLPFRELTSQGRKYKVAVIGAVQSLAQFALDYNEAFVNTMLNTMRHHIVFGGISPYDAKMFVESAGKEKRFNVSTRDAETPSRIEGASRTEAVQVSEVLENFIETSDLIYQMEGKVYARLTLRNVPRRPQVVQTHYVDYEASDTWKDKLNPKAVQIWMNYVKEQKLSRTQKMDIEQFDAQRERWEPVDDSIALEDSLVISDFDEDITSVGEAAKIVSAPVDAAANAANALEMPQMIFTVIDDSQPKPLNNKQNFVCSPPETVEENQQLVLNVIEDEDDQEEKKMNDFLQEIRDELKKA